MMYERINFLRSMSIPHPAKKVFSGIIFDVYQWPQKMYDGSTETFEMLKRADTVQVIATRGDKILLAYETQPTKGPAYTLFGGRVDKGEKPLAAAKRELKEESGLTAKNWQILKRWRPFNKIDWEIFLYVARACRQVSAPTLDPGEKIETREVSFDQFVKIVTQEKFWGKELTIELLRRKVEGTVLDFRKKLFL